MSVKSAKLAGADATAHEAAPLRYLARQPILDRNEKLFGYELLYRAAPEGAGGWDGDRATRIMLDNTVLFGLSRLTGGLPAFLNCTLEALTGSLLHVAPSSMTVLEVLESLTPTPELADACRRLKARGFRIALDDFVWSPAMTPLIELADYIKVDFLLTGLAERRKMLTRLRGSRATLLAEKVETREEYEQACTEGFTLFQGYYFCRPELIRRREIPPNSAIQLELLKELQNQPIDLQAVTRLVERDTAIAYRLLRLVNSPALAMRREVRSVQSALIAVGENIFRQMATLAIASELNAGRPAEILRMALVRARFCELSARLTWRDTTEQYLLGLLSLLPAMMQVPMEEAIGPLPLRNEIRAALLGQSNEDRCLLSWMEASQQGDWATCDRVAAKNSLAEDQLQSCAAEATEWADRILRSG